MISTSYNVDPEQLTLENRPKGWLTVLRDERVRQLEAHKKRKVAKSTSKRKKKSVLSMLTPEQLKMAGFTCGTPSRPLGPSGPDDFWSDPAGTNTKNTTEGTVDGDGQVNGQVNGQVK